MGVTPGHFRALLIVFFAYWKYP